jgi:hypothetical protein
MRTSHESIYRYVYVVARRARKRELAAWLRRHHTKREAHPRGTLDTRGKLKDMALIDHRLPEVQTRASAAIFKTTSSRALPRLRPSSSSSNALPALCCRISCRKKTPRACAQS